MHLAAALRKDLLLQWRGRAQVAAIFVFGATLLLLFSFAIGPDSAALRQHATTEGAAGREIVCGRPGSFGAWTSSGHWTTAERGALTR